MTAAEFVAELQQLGVRVWDEAGEQLHYRAPKGVMTPERLAALREHKQALLEFLRAGPQVTVLAQPDARYEPFPLTEIQSAYLIGRRDVVAYGGVACHAYGELAFAELDPARLERAWQLLIARHDMLRAVIHADGFQRVLPDVPAYHLRVDDVRGASADDVAEAVAITRHELDHQVRAPGEWPLFELRATLADERALLHVSIDFLIADYVSIFVLLDEMRQLYDEPERALPPLEITFRDYLMAERALRSGPRYETDRAYWWGRIDDLPARPQLPAVSPASGNAAARFRRWQASFASPEWDAFRRTAAGEEITPSVAVLAAYAETVARWSRHQRFTLNVTMLQRLPLHRHVDALVGDFTSVNLLAVDGDTPASFRDRAHALQVQLWEDIDHRLCSGVEVMREIARRRGPEAAIMPVVFTSAIGLTKGGGGNTARAGMGEIGHGISQTPQVWIDCQVMERDGALAVNWDVRDGVFPDGLVDDMFGAFVDAVRRLSRDELAWT
nr:condensation domain-containing protein [Candidatus Eremiobacteraeota bacterium]